MSDGWIKLHRKTLECPLVMVDAEYLALWVYLLLKATHKEMPVIFGKEKMMLMPGQLITGYTQIASDLGISRSKAQRIIKRYADDMQIETHSNSKGTLISIVNWDKYQLCDTDFDTEMIRNRYASDTQVNTNKNIKNVRKKEINIIKDTSPVQIELPLNDGTMFPVTSGMVEEYKSLYPSVDVEQELRNMKGWCNSNPTKRKTKKGISRFINSWLARVQDKGGNVQKTKTNQFNSIETRGYDFDSLEKKLGG